MFQRQWRQAQRPRKHGTKAKTAGKKMVARKKPVWDSTVNDLTVHQLTKEELDLRRSRLLSKNADRAKRELEEIAKGVRQLSSASSNRSSSVGKTSGKAPEKEVEQQQLHNVLEESDRALSVVKDLFGDDPKRYSGQPNVTVAPRVIMDKAALQRTLLESRQDGPTPSALNSPGGIRDESVLGLTPVKPALNDIPSPSSEFTLDESNFEDSSLQLSPPVFSYQPAVVHFPRFQRLVDQQSGETGEGGGGEVGDRGEAEELSSIAHTGSQKSGANATVDSIMGTSEGGESEGRAPSTSAAQPQTVFPAPKQHHPLQIAHKMAGLQPTTAGSSTPNAAPAGVPSTLQHSNSVSRNQRLRRLPPGKAVTVGAAGSSIYDDLSVLQKLVQDLERELQEYEHTSGYCFPVKKPAATQSGTFTSLTVSLLASVTKLTHYLKQSEVQLKGEVAVRNQLLHAMAEQQNLMDALTADVVKLQDENTSLRSGLQQLELSTTQQTKTIKEDLLELREKVRTLEEIKPERSTISVAGGKLHTPNVPSPAVASSLLEMEDIAASLAPSSQNTASPLPPTPQVNLSSSSGVVNAANMQGPLLNSTPINDLTPTPAPYMKPMLPLPAVYYHPHAQPLAYTQQSIDSTPANLPYDPSGRLMKPSFHLPFTPLFATPALSVAGVSQGLSVMSMSESDVGASPVPLSLPSQLPPRPPTTLPSAPLLFQTVPLPKPFALHHHSHNPSPLTSSKPPSAPLSLPYSWEAPVPTCTTLGVGGSTMYTATSTQHSVTSANPIHPTPSYAAPKVVETTAPDRRTAFQSMAAPDLSLSPANSALDTSRPHNISPSQSDSSLDIEASLARMSSLARSVLQELAQDRGHLMRATQPPHPSVPAHTPQVAVGDTTESTRSSMTTVTSLDSAVSEVTRVESMTLQDTHHPPGHTSTEEYSTTSAVSTQ